VTNPDGSPKKGHRLYFETDPAGMECAKVDYYLEDTLEPTQFGVDLLGPELDPVAHLTATGDDLAPNVPHIGKLLHNFGAPPPEIGAEHIAVFAGADAHGPEYRDHCGKRMLAVNDRQALGNWKVKHVHFMTLDYSAPQPFADHIFRQGEALFVEVALERTAEGPGAPASVGVRLRSTVTDPAGFALQVPRHHTTADGKLAYYRPTLGDEPSIGPQTDAAAGVIGVKATGESVHERTTHDDHDYSDSEAVPYGAERGKGRAAADVSEARGVLPANLEYLQAAGVEFLVVSSAADPTKKDKVPAKNQADLLYFSGHGRVATGRIYNESYMEWPDHTVSVADIDPG